MTDRYSRQQAFYGIGKDGQEKLNASRVTVIGIGALGTATANYLVRAGIGFVRLVDRDYVELSNLQRQVIFTEEDAKNAYPKAEAAAQHLKKVNSEIEIEPVVTDFNASTVSSLIGDVDLIIDATDNLEARFLLNEACQYHKKDWIYGGALGSSGMTANYLYGEDLPCMHCLTKYENYKGNGPTCMTAGVLSMTTSIVSGIQCAEALKILTGADNVRKTLYCFDLWNNETSEIPLFKDPDCDVCVHARYQYFGKKRGMEAVSLCGRNEVQVIPENTADVNFEEFAGKFAPLGKVTYNKYTLDYDGDEFGIKLFKNGRAIIKNVDDVKRAKSIYTEYIGI